MLVLVHVRRVLARRPWLYWAIVGGLALTAGALVSHAASGIDDAKAAWGDSRSVVVAISGIEPGAPLAGATETRRLPSPMVPSDAITALEPGATARQQIAPGEVVVLHDVAASSGPQVLIPDGWLAVAIAEPVPSGARTGDRVSVASGGVLLAGEAVVVESRNDAVLVAVPAGDAPQIAQAASTGDVALLLEPG